MRNLYQRVSYQRVDVKIIILGEVDPHGGKQASTGPRRSPTMASSTGGAGLLGSGLPGHGPAGPHGQHGAARVDPHEEMPIAELNVLLKFLGTLGELPRIELGDGATRGERLMAWRTAVSAQLRTTRRVTLVTSGH